MVNIENIQEYFCVKCSGKLQLINENEFICGVCSSKYGAKYILNSQVFLKDLSENEILIPEAIINETVDTFKELCNINLDETYYLSGSARSDFQSKIRFYEDSFLPNLNKWENDILEKNDKLIEIKLKLVTEIYSISKSIIRDYFDPFISNAEKGVYNSFLDVNEYKLDIDSSQLLELSEGFAAPTVLDVLSNVTDKVNFKKLNRNLENLSSGNEWKRRKAQKNLNIQTVDIAFNAIEAGISAIKDNAAAIKAIRKANEEFDEELIKVENNIKRYSIKQKDVIKKLKYANIQDKIFETCLNNFKKVITEFESNELFLEFKSIQSKFSRREKLILNIKDIISQNISIPFWYPILKDEKELFQIIFNKKLKKIPNQEEFQNLATEFNFNPYSNIEILAFERSYIEEYYAFHNDYSQRLKSIVGYNDTKEHVKYFASVLRTIKQFINN